MNGVITHLKSLLAARTDLLEGIDKVYVYGSVARNQHKDTSDVDLILVTSEPLTLNRLLTLEDYLSSEMHREIDAHSQYSLDVAERQTRRKERYDQIRKERIEVWNRR